MASISNTLIITALVVYLIVSWRTQVLINQSLLNHFQKRVNSILTWLIPFIWVLVVKTMIKPPENPVTIKKDCKTPMGGEAGQSVAGSNMAPG